MKNCQIKEETTKRQNCLRVKPNYQSTEKFVKKMQNGQSYKRHKMIKEKDKNSLNETNVKKKTQNM